VANRFDNVAKALAAGMPRRTVLKALVGGAAVAVTTTVADRGSVARAADTEHSVNYVDPCVNNFDPTCNYTHPPKSPPNHEPVVNVPSPVVNIPVPVFPHLNQTILPPKLELLPKLVPSINWNFVPFDPTRRHKSRRRR
jgi:hypothetical protein